MDDRTAIFDYVSEDNFVAAVRLDDMIQADAERLEQFPEMGRDGRIAGTRELVIAGTSYIAAYSIDKGEVKVWRVLHGAQRWPDTFSFTE